MEDTQVNEKLSTFEKFSYGMGGCAEVLMANMILILALRVYYLGLGVGSGVIGLILGISKFFDAFIDPLMGNISDNSRLRWGRRKPFILIGGIVTGIFCMLLWLPPTGFGKAGITLYFGIISFLFYISYTVFYVPFNAIGYEMTSDYDERTRLMSVKWFIAQLGGVLILPFILPLCYRINSSSAVIGARWVGLGIGIAVILSCLLPALVPKERRVHQESIPFLKALLYTFRNKSFVILCGIILLSLVGIFIDMPMRQFFNMAYIFEMDEKAAADMNFLVDITYGVLGFASIPLINWLAIRYGKKLILVIGLSIVAFGMAMSWFYITPSCPKLQLLFGVFVGPGMSCVWVLTSSCIADVCDEDELSTGLRREGLYGAVFSFLMKSGAAISLALAGFVIKWTGFDNNLAKQTAETVRNMRATFAFAPVILLTGAIILACIYPLTRKRVEEVQDQLKQRKQEAEANPELP